jgi:hypothetical protein
VFGTAALSCGLLTGVSVADSAYTPLVTHTLSPHLTRTVSPHTFYSNLSYSLHSAYTPLVTHTLSPHLLQQSFLQPTLSLHSLSDTHTLPTPYSNSSNLSYSLHSAYTPLVTHTLSPHLLLNMLSSFLKLYLPSVRLLSLSLIV